MRTARKLFWLLLLLAAPGLAFAQGVRVDNPGGPATRNVQNFLAPIPGAIITVCTSAATGTPCSPLVPTSPVTLCTDSSCTVAAANSFLADANGNWGAWLLPGTYKVSITASGVTGQLLTVTLPAVLGPGGTLTANLISPSTNPAASGFTRAASGDSHCWRNAANTADLCLSKTAGDLLQWNGDTVATLTAGQAFSNHTFDISLNTLKTATNTAGHVPRNNGTQYVDGQLAAADLSDGVIGSGSLAKATALQGTDANLLTAGTVSASTGVALCTDANHGATTSGCTPGGVTEASLTGFAQLGNSSVCAGGVASCPTYVFANTHTLVRVVANMNTAPSGCSPNASWGVRDITSSSTLASVTPTSTGVTDSGALSVTITAGHQIALGITTQAAGCTTVGQALITAVMQ